MARNSCSLVKILSLALLLCSCAKHSDVGDASGTVSVQIPVQESADSYQLKTVQLFAISKLPEVSGHFARFFYSAGLSGSQLTGSSPKAHFIKSGSTFIPTDIISTQMATIYYHMQNMANLDLQLGAGETNQWPRSVGLETQIVKDDSRIEKNNAFYDGVTDAMMFVPFTESELPITFNAGIIAHEHFHSLFYKLVIKKAAAANKIAPITSHSSPMVFESTKLTPAPNIISEKTRVGLFNQLYLRGLNEGLADFWGWLYTNDPNFMKWSLPAFSNSRTLSLQSDDAGEYVTQERINAGVDDILHQSSDSTATALDYYKIGTPHARFLKQWTDLYSKQKQISLADAKIIIGQKIVKYLTELQKSISTLGESETISPDHLFKYFADQAKNDKLFSLESCEFILKYLNFEKANKDLLTCQQKDQLTIIQKIEDKVAGTKPK